jgi:Zn-finger nucleic acid-binding protein
MIDSVMCENCATKLAYTLLKHAEVYTCPTCATIQEVRVDFSGKLVKETEDTICLSNGDGTATWYDLTEVSGLHKNPLTDVVTFRGPRTAVIRSCKL